MNGIFASEALEFVHRYASTWRQQQKEQLAPARRLSVFTAFHSASFTSWFTSDLGGDGSILLQKERPGDTRRVSFHR